MRNPRVPAPSGCIGRRLFSAVAVLLALAAPLPAPAQLAVYTDSLQNGFSDWSWAAHDLAQTAVVRSGSAAVSFEPDGWEALFLHRDAGFTSAEYEAIQLWIRGAGAGGQQVTIAILNDGTAAASAPLAGFVEGGTIPAGSWDGIWLQEASGGNQPTLYVDGVRLLPNTSPPPVGGPVTVSVEPELDRRPVSPYIFGVNFGTAAQAAELKWPSRRWGGNSVTRYNWQNDTSNKGVDWFFMNVPDDNPDPSTLPFG